MAVVIKKEETRLTKRAGDDISGILTLSAIFNRRAILFQARERRLQRVARKAFGAGSRIDARLAVSDAAGKACSGIITEQVAGLAGIALALDRARHTMGIRALPAYIGLCIVVVTHEALEN